MPESYLLELSDQALIARCLTRGASDDRPFAELYSRHKEFIWQVCYRYSNDPQEAEDLMQEVFFKVYRSLHQFEGRSAFRTWLYRIAVNTARNEIRRKRRRVQESPAGDWSDEYQAEPAPQETLTEWYERREILLGALSLLDEDALEALLLRDVEEQPYEKIASRLDLSLSAAKMRVARARTTLQAAYLALEAEHEPV
jgi:RNA polymerase sigma-70 factor (ECF subfamily)